MRTDLIGHERAWRLLTMLVDRKKLPAAVLLSGPPHVGKRALATALAARLLGTATPKETLASPDVLRVTPEDESSSKERMNALLVNVATRPVVARFRVVLVEDLERADRTAIPLLLKVIEDAPAFSRFLITATYPERLPATVASRSLMVALTRVPTMTIRSALIARGVSASDAERVADLSGGRPGLALRLAADDALRAQYAHWAKLGRGGGLRGERITFGETREQAEDFLVFLQGAVGGEQRVGVLRRTREGLAMLALNVPAPLVVEFVLASFT